MNLSLNEMFEEVTFTKGQLVFREGQTSDYIYLVKRGRVACATIGNDRVVPVYSVKDQGVVGEDCIFSPANKYFYSAVALEETVTSKIAKEDILTYVDACSDWVKNILTDLSEKIDHTSGLISEHRIVDERLNAGELFAEEEEKLILNSIS